MTINSIIEQFRKELSELALYQDDTISNYISCIYNYIQFAKETIGIDPIKTTPKHLKQWMIHLKTSGTSNSRLSHHKSALTGLFTFMTKINVIPDNPADALFPVKKNKSDLNQPIDQNTACEMLKAIDRSKWIDKRNFMIISSLYALGLRRAELTKLKIKHFDPNYDPANKIGMLIVHGKGRKQRALFVVDKLYQNLLNYLAHPKSPKMKHHPIFPNNKGKSISGDQVLKIVRQAASKAGIKQRITPHVLRHSFATEMYLLNIPLDNIEDIMGHENQAETALYIHVPEKLKQQALEMISLDDEYSWPYLYGGNSRLLF